jgi:cell wall assembly regulator SMI1
MRDIWQRIKAALRTSAPDLLARLPDGASADDIAAIEARLGFTLPDEVRESYALHDGSGEAEILPQWSYGRVNGVSLLPLDRVASEREIWVELLDDGDFEGNEATPDGPVKRDWWNRWWVPVTSNGGGDHLCIDLDPAPSGVVGQVIDFSHESGPKSVVAPGLRTFLAAYAADLESGRLRFGADRNLVATDDAYRG